MAHKDCSITGRQSGEDGKSLVEIAIVVMIISVVIAFALPAVANSIRLYNLRSACERVAERLAGGRALAMAKNRNVTIAFATGESGAVTQYGYDFSPVNDQGTSDPQDDVATPDGTPDAIDPLDETQSYFVETPPAGMNVTFSAGGKTLANGKGVTYTSRGELEIGASQADIRVANSSGSLTVSVNLRGQVWIH
ncbi:MAG TPA: hypothetical protein VLM38_00455 [Blastocatellia bacterium]|nr:hypothetical protein [Blastocatellia bacterium]